MRIFIVCIFFIAVTTSVQGQFDFKPDSIYSPIQLDELKGSTLESLNFDTTKFQFRYWVLTSFLGECLLVFNQNINGEWSYKRIGMHNEDFLELPVEGYVPPIDSIWAKLIENQILTLPSQDIFTASFKKDGHLYKLSLDQFEKLGGTDGTVYEIELITKERYRSYYYYNPVELNQSFKNSDLEYIVPEHEAFSQVVTYLNETFKINSFLIEYFKYRKNKK